MGFALASDPNNRQIYALVGPDNGSIGFGAETKAADCKPGRAHHALFDKVSSFCHCSLFCTRYKLNNYLQSFKE